MKKNKLQEKYHTTPFKKFKLYSSAYVQPNISSIKNKNKINHNTKAEGNCKTKNITYITFCQKHHKILIAYSDENFVMA